MTGQLWWYAARAGGFVAWGLLSASVIWGLLLSNKLRPGKVRPNWILDLHRFLGGLAVVFTGVHVLTIMADSYTSFGPTDVLVPFVSSWKPLAVAWGIVSLYVLLAVELTSLVKRHLPSRLWRRVHVLSLPLFATATIHLLTAGTDAGNRVVTWLVAAVSATVVALTAWQLSHLRSSSSPRSSSTPRTTTAHTATARTAAVQRVATAPSPAPTRSADRAAMIRAAREAAAAAPSTAPSTAAGAARPPTEPPYYDGPWPPVAPTTAPQAAPAHAGPIGADRW